MYTIEQLAFIEELGQLHAVQPAYISSAALTKEVGDQIDAATSGSPRNSGGSYQFGAGMVVGIGGSGSGKTRLITRAAAERGAVVYTTGEPPRHEVGRFDTSYVTELLLGLAISRVSANVRSTQKKSIKQVADTVNRLYVEAHYEKWDKKYDTPASKTAHAAEEIKRFLKRAKGHVFGSDQTVYIDSITPLLTRAGGAATAGGYPRELPSALLAIDRVALMAQVLVVTVINPFASERRDIALVETMVDGSVLGFFSISGDHEADLGGWSASQAVAGSIQATLSVSIRPDLRGVHKITPVSFTIS